MRNPAAGRWLGEEVARERLAFLRADDLEYFCPGAMSMLAPVGSCWKNACDCVVSDCCLFAVGHGGRRWREHERSSTCSPAYRPPAAPPAVIMCAVSREGGRWRGRATVQSRMCVCVCGDATHTLRDEAKDEGGLVASAGHLPCRPKVRACWACCVLWGGFCLRRGVCSGGGIRGC